MGRIKYAVGDRVRLRGTQWKGKVVHVYPGDGWLDFQRDENGVCSKESRECFIRIKPKAKLREFWIIESSQGFVATSEKPHQSGMFIHVREVRRK